MLVYRSGDVEGHQDPVANLLLADALTDGDDFTHELMTQHVALAHFGDEPVEQMQVGPADRGRSDSDHDIGRFLDGRVIDSVDLDLAGPLKSEGAHRLSPA